MLTPPAGTIRPCQALEMASVKSIPHKQRHAGQGPEATPKEARHGVSACGEEYSEQLWQIGAHPSAKVQRSLKIELRAQPRFCICIYTKHSRLKSGSSSLPVSTCSLRNFVLPICHRIPPFLSLRRRRRQRAAAPWAVRRERLPASWALSVRPGLPSRDTMSKLYQA